MEEGYTYLGTVLIDQRPADGSDTAAAVTAAATSWAAIGWSLAVGTLTVSPAVAESAMALRNSKNCVEQMMV
jgi:hypothetical protein